MQIHAQRIGECMKKNDERIELEFTDAVEIFTRLAIYRFGNQLIKYSFYPFFVYSFSGAFFLVKCSD